MLLTRLGRTSRLKGEVRFLLTSAQLRRPNFESVNSRSTLVRYFADSKSNHPPHVVHASRLKPDGEEGHRIVDNNNQNPAVSIPGGLAFPFLGGSSAGDAAITTMIGLTMGNWSYFYDSGTVRLTSRQCSWEALRMLRGIRSAFWTK